MFSLGIIDILTVYSVFIPFVIGLFLFKNFQVTEKIIFLHVVIGILTEIIAYSIAYYKGNNVMFLSFYSLIELIIYILFYSFFYRSKSFNAVSLVILMMFGGFYLLDFFLNGFRLVYYFSNAMESIVMVCMALAFLVYLIRFDVTDNLLGEPFFWINAGILIYFSGNLTLFTLGKFVPRDVMVILWGFIHNSLNFLLYISFSIAFWKTRKRI